MAARNARSMIHRCSTTVFLCRVSRFLMLILLSVLPIYKFRNIYTGQLIESYSVSELYKDAYYCIFALCLSTSTKCDHDSDFPILNAIFVET